MQEIPLQNIPSQTMCIVLAGQNCQIFLYQKDEGLFFDLNSNATDIVTGIICENGNPLVCIQYSGFSGNLLFVDTQGNNDPTYDGLSIRYNLVYLTASEYDLIQ